MIFLVSLLAKIIAFFFRLMKFGAGVTWPGEISLRLDDHILEKLFRGLKKGVILVAGTNGKTTTASMIGHILQDQGYKIIHNSTGANLRNGICGTLILKTNFFGKINADYAILETDEATFGPLVNEINPQIVVLLNLFRDQLDRYGEVDAIADKWISALAKINKKMKLIVNADDPLISYIGKKYPGTVSYFGLKNHKYNIGKLNHATDSIYCLNCGNKLSYHKVFLSHFGDWYCAKCKAKRPKLDLSEVSSPLPGVYNIYNSLAGILTVVNLAIDLNKAQHALNTFSPAFGRQEIFNIQGKKIQIFLSKNPAGFNESLRTVLMKKDLKTILLVLNDRIPDGTDVSWIWDVDFEDIVKRTKTIICSGDRVFDIGLRIKYAKAKFKTIEDLKKAINYGLQDTKIGETLYIFPTYSAMLDIRKILVGRKIL